MLRTAMTANKIISYPEQCRLAANKSVAQVAAFTGFSIAYVRQIERLAARWAAGEKVILPSEHAMRRYSHAVGRGVDIFFNRKGAKQADSFTQIPSEGCRSRAHTV